MSERLQAIDRYLDEHLDGYVDELARLCAVPSVSARHEGIAECAALVAELLGRRGLRARVVATAGQAPLPVCRGRLSGASRAPRISPAEPLAK